MNTDWLVLIRVPYWLNFKTLQRANSIKPARIIRPLRVGEIKSAAIKGVGCYRRPDSTAQVSGGFHNDGEVGRPEDRKTKFVGLQAKATVQD